MEQKWEQPEVEEQEQQQEEEEEEEEEAALILRKHANGNESKAAEVAADEEVEVEESNGVSESNGHEVHAENGAEYDELATPKEEELRTEEELDGVLESKPEAILNGEQNSENLVFYDETEGVESPPTHFEEKRIERDNGPNNFATSSLDHTIPSNHTSIIDNRNRGDNESSSSNFQPSQISFQEHVTGNKKSSEEIESEEVNLINEDDDLEVTDVDVERVLKTQNTHDLFCPNCNSCITRRVILRKRKRRIRISDEDVKRNKTEVESTKLDIGSVLQSHRKQGHHTEGVDNYDAQIATVQEEDERDRGGPDIFRCLSCFSFFIPTGNGFKLFRTFGEKGVKEDAPNEQAPNIKKNWFTSLFASNKQEPAVLQGSNLQTGVQKVDVGSTTSSNVGGHSGQPSPLPNISSSAHASEALPATGKNDSGKVLSFRGQEASLNGNATVGVGDKQDMTSTETVDIIFEHFDAYTENELKESKPIKEVNTSRERDLPGNTLPMRTNGKEEGISISKQDGLKLLISSGKEGSLTVENSEEGQLWNHTMQSGRADKEAIQFLPTSVPVLRASDVDGTLNIAVSIPHEHQDVKATILTESVLENKNANFKSSNGGEVYPSEMSNHTITKTKFEIHSSEQLNVDTISAIQGAATAQGKDTIITIDAQPGGASQTLLGITRPTETADISQSVTEPLIAGGQRITQESEEFEIEVIKSIVYGGLAESITSLSVVSSAAGGGAATLNVLALGVANLIGGLFIIFHNLWELRCDSSEQVANQVSDDVTQQRDRYRELLGRRQNYIVHALVAIISYLIFGSIPPIVYGFSFRRTDDKQFKLVSVAVASLLCILFLAIGRAYVRRPPKHYLKSIITFLILGFMVSGVSYAAGGLVERLLVKFDVFEPNSVSNLLGPEMRQVGSRWASY